MIKQLLLASAYFAAGWLGLQIPSIGTHITLVWLPTGIAVAALLLWGRGVWPGVYLGAFLVNLAIGSAWPLAASIAIGNTLGPLLTATWLKRVGFQTSFARQKDVALFISGAMIGMMVSASGGVMSLYFAGLLPVDFIASAWFTWWMGDAIGVLLAAPIVLSLGKKRFVHPIIKYHKEFVLWILVATPTAWFAFVHDYHGGSQTLPLAYLTLPMLAWAALRFGNTGATLSGLAFSVVAAWATATGHGAFYMEDTHVSLFLIWSYMATIVLTGLLITAMQAERWQVVQTLHESEAKLRGLYELSPLGIVLTDMDGKFIEFNQAFQDICGYSTEELHTLDYWELTPRKYEADEARQLASLQRIGCYGPYEKEYIHKDGHLIPLRLNGMVITASDGKQQIWSIVEDITISKRSALALRRENEKNQALLRNASDGIHILDMKGNILEVSDSFCTMLGYRREEMAGMNVTRWDVQFPVAEIEPTIKQQYDKQARSEFTTKHKRKDGHSFDVEISGFPLELDGKPVMFYSSRDVTDRLKAEDEIKHLAFYDTLTNLPNRRLLTDRLSQAIATSARSGRKGALLFIDLDNFKTLNDTLGHDQGDLLLQQVAQRLAGCVRQGDTVARFGGDEFVVMLVDLSENMDEAATVTKNVGEKILATLNQSYQLDEHVHHSTSSIGATLFDGHQHPIEELLKHADMAMYKAKEAGRNVMRFFDLGMQSAVTVRAALENDLRYSIPNHEFILYYQPQVDRDGRMTGAEALVRWLHPQRGMVPPDEFIHVAEETGLILPLGKWILETACAQLALWAKQPELAHLTLAVNISVRQFQHEDFVEQVLAVIDQAGIDPNKLKLEITESIILDNVEDIITKMDVLKNHGVGFSLDDFGTGYSSLSYLKRLPLDQLKIDKSFVRDVFTDTNDAAIARTIVSLAHGLELSVIAEGVETNAQQNFLANAGCFSYQGYLFSRPLPVAEFELFMKQQ
ncbi:bifunctional diguanylate cyclase/phosphodiesterase [Sulfuriferula nivalis]|uniref:Diguanylate cyclase/phosphodiesterase n=1 Tax=Sulfuriferula nivalis TaxID=2675298 RepID=A0A809S9P4_9PROT|nr:EAL domain-containing protein [Sulfuriferula nivalis]BBP01413.1 hypothetical protein SFSGTM_21210 [Sulfuriferula nivalis]